MSIWKRIAKAISALVEGESLTAVLERMRTPPEQSIAFTIAVIALGAKMAKADGQVTRDEISAFRRIFVIPQTEETHAARIFNMARTDIAGFEGYARHIAKLLRKKPALLADLFEGLVIIAMADGVMHPGEKAFLERVQTIFGLSERVVHAIHARHHSQDDNPYRVLNADPGMSDAQLRVRYRKLVRELHPDNAHARGIPHEARRLAEQRLARVNDAYATIRADRKKVSSMGR